MWGQNPHSAVDGDDLFGFGQVAQTPPATPFRVAASVRYFPVYWKPPSMARNTEMSRAAILGGDCS
jgi:hypothetical protein